MEEKDGKGLEQSVLQLCCAEGGAAGGPEAGQIQMRGAGLLQDGGKVHHIVELTEINVNDGLYYSSGCHTGTLYSEIQWKF